MRRGLLDRRLASLRTLEWASIAWLAVALLWVRAMLVGSVAAVGLSWSLRTGLVADRRLMPLAVVRSAQRHAGDGL